MERLTIKAPSGLIHLGDNEADTINRAIKKLSDYEDLEEQGLLFRLPCKVGDVLEWVDALGEKHTDTVNCIYIEQGLNDIQIETLCCQIGANEIGKTVLFVKEEAEAALEKMKGEEHE